MALSHAYCHSNWRDMLTNWDTVTRGDTNWVLALTLIVTMTLTLIDVVSVTLIVIMPVTLMDCHLTLIMTDH